MNLHGRDMEHLGELAELIDAEGLDGYEARVRAVARVGETVAPVAASVLGDPREPVVARLRAFAVVTAALRSDGSGRVPAAAKLGVSRLA